MGELLLNCPLCCGEIFKCQKSLKEHLLKYIDKLKCPQCNDNFNSIKLLVNHLEEGCKHSFEISLIKANEVRTLPSEEKDTSNSRNEDVLEDLRLSDANIEEEGSQSAENPIDEELSQDLNNESSSQAIPDEEMEMNIMQQNETEEVMKMLMKTDGLVDGLNGQFKLVHDGEQGQYLIVTDDSVTMLGGDSVVTTQNSDGTVSFTPVKKETSAEQENLQTESKNTRITQSVDKDTPEDVSEEVYSCNTCGVSFTSVLEHIRAFHSDQDVVVEVTEQGEHEGEEILPNNSIENTLIQIPEMEADEGVPASTRRVITDTGDIVETQDNSALCDVSISTVQPAQSQSKIIRQEQCVDKGGRLYMRKLVQIDKFWNKPDSEVNTADKKVVGKGRKPSRVPRREAIVKEVLAGDAIQNVYSCARCNDIAYTLEDFNKHECANVKYRCSQCPVTYNNSKSLCAHMKVHKPSKHIVWQENGQEPESPPPSSDVISALGPYKCDACDTVFPTNKSLRLHRRMHDPVKSRPVEPPVQYTAATFGTPPSDVPDMFHCEECGKWIHEGYRAVHTSYHRSATQYNCDICNRKFLSQDYLQMHMNVHSHDKAVAPKSDKLLPYMCIYCNRQFARPHEKVKHERIHTGEKPHSCEICGKSFRVSYCLTLHMRTHTGARPYACPHCGKRFKAHSVYNHHLLTHSEVRAYKCPFCPKAFKTSVQLAGHKNSHTKPFSCTHCNRPFASLYAVRVHTETHRRQNNLKFCCGMCGASYARAFALKDHIKQAHPGVDVKHNISEETYKVSPNTVLPVEEGDADPLSLHREDDIMEVSEPQMAELTIGGEDGPKVVLIP